MMEDELQIGVQYIHFKAYFEVFKKIEVVTRGHNPIANILINSSKITQNTQKLKHMKIILVI